MERSSPVHPPKKFSSFSSGQNEDKPREMDRNLSLGNIKLVRSQHASKRENNYIIEEGDEGGEEEEKEGIGHNNTSQPENTPGEEQVGNINSEEPEASFGSVTEDIENFLKALCNTNEHEEQNEEPLEIPELTIEQFVNIIEGEITKYESTDIKWSPNNDELALLTAIDRVSKLTSALSKFSSHPKYNEAMNKTGSLLHHAMSFLEDEFHSILVDPITKQESNTSNSKTKRPLSFARQPEPDHCVLPAASESDSSESTPIYPAETIERLHGIADSMISAGYETECCQLFSIARRNAFETGFSSLGFERYSIEDTIKMPWETLEVEIASWIKAFKHIVDISFTTERELCYSVFAGHKNISFSLFHNFAHRIIIHMLTFAEAVAMSKRAAEKLFKVLDMHEALSDMLPILNTHFPANTEEHELSLIKDLRLEIVEVQCKLGEAAVSIFCELENSIKSDTGKTPMQGGAVHPLTRYVMNYVEYACEYKKTLEETFKKHKKTENISSYDDECNGNNHQGREYQHNNTSKDSDNSFAAQLVEIMALLDSNMDWKSKLYKDPALCNIFLMNNWRYIMQKIKGSTELNQLLGNTWRRKRSSALQQYHKNYQRETWSKVLACLRDDGLQVKGSVQKPVLKERFKSFNALFEEIHKTQSAWVVSDEQLQSELRVSIAAVVVPAYRSFLGRYSQHFTPGRQTEKYIKLCADDLESYIDDFFSGNPSTLASRRRS